MSGTSDRFGLALGAALVAPAALALAPAGSVERPSFLPGELCGAAAGLNRPLPSAFVSRAPAAQADRAQPAFGAGRGCGGYALHPVASRGHPSGRV